MRKYEVIHDRVMTCKPDIQELLDDLQEVDDRDKYPTERIDLIGWLIAFFQPWPGKKFLKIDGKNIGGSRWLDVKINKLESPPIQSLFRDLVKMHGQTHQEYHDGKKLYVFLNSVMRKICTDFLRHRKK